jgi:hypothetical protein
MASSSHELDVRLCLEGGIHPACAILNSSFDSRQKCDMLGRHDYA